jgi:hypothetical protein
MCCKCWERRALRARIAAPKVVGSSCTPEQPHQQVNQFSNAYARSSTQHPVRERERVGEGGRELLILSQRGEGESTSCTCSHVNTIFNHKHTVRTHTDAGSSERAFAFQTPNFKNVRSRSSPGGLTNTHTCAKHQPTPWLTHHKKKIRPHTKTTQLDTLVCSFSKKMEYKLPPSRKTHTHLPNPLSLRPNLPHMTPKHSSSNHIITPFPHKTTKHPLFRLKTFASTTLHQPDNTPSSCAA